MASEQVGARVLTSAAVGKLGCEWWGLRWPGRRAWGESERRGYGRTLGPGSPLNDAQDAFKHVGSDKFLTYIMALP